MPAKFWQQAIERREQRKADELRKKAAAAADWRDVREAFQSRLKALGAPPTIKFRRYTVQTLLSAPEFAWWPRIKADQNERVLLAADAVRDVRLVEMHGGSPQPNPALTTLRLLDIAEEAGEAAKVAMLVRALLHYRVARGDTPISTKLTARIRAACDSAHPITRDLTWSYGSKDVLPIRIPARDEPADLAELVEQLAQDGADLLRNWVAVMVADPYFCRKNPERDNVPMSLPEPPVRGARPDDDCGQHRRHSEG